MRKTTILWTLLLLGGCVPVGTESFDPDGPAPEPTQRAALGSAVSLRLMAGNLTSGTRQAYEDPGIRIFRGLHPDVALVQEFNYKTNSVADLRSFVDQAFGPEFSYFREANAQIPNGIISRYAIADAGEWHDEHVSNRDFAWARIDVPGPVDLYAVSVHLLSSDSAKRQLEAQQLVERIAALPAGAYVVLGGDLNTGSRTEASVTTLAQVVATGGPFPVDSGGDADTNGPRSKPYDWVLPNALLLAQAQPVVVGANRFSNGFVVDTRVYAPIEDLLPAQATDSGAYNMQHMGVVRDFLLPGDLSATVAVTAPNGGETWLGGSTHAITWSATQVDSVRVEVTLDGTSWTTVVAATPASAGSLSWVVPATATTAARVRVSAAEGDSPSDLSDAPFNIALPRPAQVFINEALANEPGADLNGELVELVNGGDGPADLSGWTISDSRAVRHVFPSGTVLDGHRALVVYAGASAIPPGLTNATAASTGQLSLNNSGDTITLANADGTVDRVPYTMGLAAADGVSFNRSPDGDPAGSFVLHTALAAQPASPGTRVDGSSF